MTVLRTPNKINSLINGTISLPTSTDTLVGRSTTDTLTNKTITSGILITPEERWQISSTALTGTVTFDINNGAAWLFTSNAAGNWIPNLRGASGVTFSSILSVGDSITVAMAVPQGTPAYYPTSLQIDASTVTVRWLGGSAPVAGSASSTDIYLYSIIKTAATPTYSVFASQSRYA